MVARSTGVLSTDRVDDRVDRHGLDGRVGDADGEGDVATGLETVVGTGDFVTVMVGCTSVTPTVAVSAPVVPCCSSSRGADGDGVDHRRSALPETVREKVQLVAAWGSRVAPTRSSQEPVAATRAAAPT